METRCSHEKNRFLLILLLSLSVCGCDLPQALPETSPESSSPAESGESTPSESGALLRRFYREPNGTESTTTYSSAGMECITVYPDGTRRIYATDPSGNVIKDGPL